jgi:hypothetical protein
VYFGLVEALFYKGHHEKTRQTIGSRPGSVAYHFGQCPAYAAGALSAKAAAIFRDVVASTPPGQFSLSDVYLLSTFAEVTALLENAARAAGRANKTEQPQKLKTLNDLAKTQVLLATKLRLSTQSRTRAETTARRHEAHKPSVYDVMKELEEWEHGRAT